MIISKKLSLCIIMSCLSAVASAEITNEKSLSYFKNRDTVTAKSWMDYDGQVIGNYPFYSKLSLKVFQLKDGNYTPVTNEISALKPGMLLDLPLYETKERYKNGYLTSDASLPMPQESDHYFWNDWDKGDREVNEEAVDFKWSKLSLKSNSRYPNSYECMVLDQNVKFETTDTNTMRWDKIQEVAKKAINDRTLIQTDSNSPWMNCFDVEEIQPSLPSDLPTVEGLLSNKALVIPELKDFERIGFSVTPISKFGYPQKGYTAWVWDISKIWGQQAPEKINGLADQDLIIPENDVQNRDASLPIAEHPYIMSPKIVPFTNNAYRVRIFDKEYYEANKLLLDDQYNLAIADIGNKNYPITNRLFKQNKNIAGAQNGFYSNRTYVAVVDILDVETLKVRKLTKQEIEEGLASSDDRLKLRVQFSRLNSDKSFVDIIPNIEDNSLTEDLLNNRYLNTYVFDPKLNEEEQVVSVKYTNDAVEYIQFKTPMNNLDPNRNLAKTDDQRVNPELSEQSFDAKVIFAFDPELDISNLETTELIDENNFIQIKNN